MRFTSPEGMRRYAALVQVAAETVVGLDFDGTLSPIVDDPERIRRRPAYSPRLRSGSSASPW
jgi:trehalose 6-phosphate phosphatase